MRWAAENNLGENGQIEKKKKTTHTGAFNSMFGKLFVFVEMVFKDISLDFIN